LNANRLLIYKLAFNSLIKNFGFQIFYFGFNLLKFEIQ